MITELLNRGLPAYVLFGARVVAYGAYVALRHLTGRPPLCFAVSDPTGEPAEIDGIPVCPIDSVARDTLIVVAVTELVQKEVLPLLEQMGFTKLLPLIQAEEHALMSAYFSEIGGFPLLAPAAPGAAPASLCLYEVSNHRDKPLSGHPALHPFECPIQAGAALTNRRIAELADDTGENISAKNKQYCEMSAAYWIWKHATSGWVGLEHYRRHLLVRPEQLSEDIDAVLPLPYLCWPNTLAQFRRFVSQNVLDALLTALKTLHPAEYEDYLAILEGRYQYTYNIVCAKREVYAAYCAWFFRITEYMETRTDIAPEIADTRALSYVAEVLTNLYFMYNQPRLRIRHAAREIYT